jgi:hypothetical protein
VLKSIRRRSCERELVVDQLENKVLVAKDNLEVDNCENALQRPKIQEDYGRN